MTLEHVAIWTDNLEGLKDYYVRYFGGVPNEKYTNEKNQFHSYFLTFQSGARLEIMMMPDIPALSQETLNMQHKGIIHLAFGVNSVQEVEAKASELQAAGFEILRGPRRTGDGYFEFETLDPDGNRLEVTTKA